MAGLDRCLLAIESSHFCALQLHGNPKGLSCVGTTEARQSVQEVPTMADRTLRGSRMGAVSYETEYGAEPAPRNVAAYRCAPGS